MFEDIKKDDQRSMSPATRTDDIFDDVDPAVSAVSTPTAVAAGKIRPVTGPVPTGQSSVMAETSGADLRPVGPPEPLQDFSQIAKWSGKANKGGFKTFIIWIISLALIVTVGYGGYWGYQTYLVPALQKASNQPTDSNTNNNTNSINANTNQPVINTNNQPVPPVSPAIIDQDGDQLIDNEETVYGTDLTNPDTDRDGLTDYEEVKIHNTNALLPDSDNDGLNDREELMTWKTDPNNPDTDGDTFQDGEEVANGYNPTGPGKLIPAENLPQQ